MQVLNPVAIASVVFSSFLCVSSAAVEAAVGPVDADGKPEIITAPEDRIPDERKFEMRVLQPAQNVGCIVMWHRDDPTRFQMECLRIR